MDQPATTASPHVATPIPRGEGEHLFLPETIRTLEQPPPIRRPRNRTARSYLASHPAGQARLAAPDGSADPSDERQRVGVAVEVVPRAAGSRGRLVDGEEPIRTLIVLRLRHRARFMEFAYLTGWRRMEMLSLSWRQVACKQ